MHSKGLGTIQHQARLTVRTTSSFFFCPLNRSETRPTSGRLDIFSAVRPHGGNGECEKKKEKGFKQKTPKKTLLKKRKIIGHGQGPAQKMLRLPYETKEVLLVYRALSSDKGRLLYAVLDPFTVCTVCRNNCIPRFRDKLLRIRVG